MKRKDKFHYFIHRVLYLIKLLKDLKIRLLLIGICISILNAILPYLTMLNTQVIINFIPNTKKITNLFRIITKGVPN